MTNQLEWTFIMYYNKFFLPIIGLAILSSLSGCAEVSALTNDIGSSMSQGVSTMVKDVNKVLTTPTSTIANQTQSATSIPTTDMVYLMGWMEDACQQYAPPTDKIADRYFAFRDSVIDMDYSKVKPRSQWSPQYRDQIQEINKRNDGSYVTFSIKLKNAYYRNQPLAAIETGYQEGTEGANAKLVFAQSANVPAIASNFKAGQMEFMGGMIDSGAVYSSRENSFNCEY